MSCIVARRFKDDARAVVFAAMCLCLVTVCSAVPGAPRWEALSQTVFRHLMPDDALIVSSIVEGNDGLIWVGTNEGLVQWDGYTARRYHASPKIGSSLVDDAVLALHVDRGGRLWIGTLSGLDRYMPECDCFAHLRCEAGRLGGESVFAVEDDAKGGIWIATDH